MPQPLRVNLLHALENFLDAYPCSPPEVALVEGVSNSIDIDASKIEISFDDKKREFSLLDNGGGMSKESFENYHTVALSSKKKGQGIGFAGVGSKIYLAASPEAEIITQTRGPDGAFASVIKREHIDQGYDDLVFDEIKPELKSKGTLYQVKMNQQDFEELKSNAEKWIVKWFNQILIGKSKSILLEGERVKAWKPKVRSSEKIEFEVKGANFEVEVIITKEKLESDLVGLNAIVFGKFVKKYDFPWQYQLKTEARDIVYAVLLADPLSEYLSLNKLEFKANHLVHSVIEKAHAGVYEHLRKKEMVLPMEEEQAAQIRTNALSNSFTKLLFSEGFKKFNPWMRVGGVDSLISKPDGTETGKTPSGDDGALSQGDNHGEEKPKDKTIGIAFVDLPENPKEGWVDIEQKAIIVNMGHKMCRKLIDQDVKAAVNLNILRVLVTAVLDYKKEELPDITPETILNLQSEMIATTWMDT